MSYILPRKKSSTIKNAIWTCLPCRIILILSAFLLGLLLVSIILVNPVLNIFVKPRIIDKINSTEGHNIKVDHLSYSFFTNTISSTGAEYRFNNEDLRLKVLVPELEVTGIPWINLIWGGTLGFSQVSVFKPVVEIFSLMPDDEDEKADTTKDIFEQIQDIVPPDRKPLEINSLNITDGIFRNTKFNASKADYVKGINIRVGGIYINHSEASDSIPLRLAGTVTVDLKEIFWRFSDKAYDLKIKSAILSSPDSTLEIAGFSFHSYKNNLDFFRGRQYRSNKITISINKFSAEGFDLSGLVRDNETISRLMTAQGASLKFLTDKRVPRDPAIIPKMPHELIASLDFKLNIGKLRINDSEIMINELWSDKLESSLQFTNLKASIDNLSSNAGDDNPMVIDIEALLADAGEVKVVMNLPLKVNRLKFDYKGSLGAMSVLPLNSHLKIADKSELVSGTIGNATFKVSCYDDSVSAAVIPIYNNLKIKTLTEESTEGGIFQDIKTFVANAFKIRESNPDKDGKIKSGNIKYKKEQKDYFLDVVWFSLRDAIGEVVGF